MTCKGSLKKWISEGIAKREFELYFEYLQRNLIDTLTLFSYCPDDHLSLDQMELPSDIKKRVFFVTPERELLSGMDHIRYSFNIRKIREATGGRRVICKTNQINGSWSALIAIFFGGIFFLRSGYILSRRCFKNGDYFKGALALTLELIATNFASLISVTTPNGKKSLARLKIMNSAKIFIAPTYVNTERFRPDPNINRKEAIVFVGRLETGKNIIALIEAVMNTGKKLLIIGRGSLEQKVTDLVAQSKGTIEHRQFMTNEEIAEVFKTHRYFALPSFHEGLPKVLIEAMSAGMVCMGTPTSGIADLISHNETGYLMQGYTVDDIQRCIEYTYSQPESDQVAQKGRAFIKKKHSIDSYIDSEFSQLKEMS